MSTALRLKLLKELTCNRSMYLIACLLRTIVQATVNF